MSRIERRYPNIYSSIGYESFRDSQLTSIQYLIVLLRLVSGHLNQQLLESLTILIVLRTIGLDAFANQLTTVDIPAGVTYLSGFGGKHLTSVDIPDGVTYLSGFGGNQLTSVEIPDSVTQISYDAFNNNQLTSVDIPDSVTTINNRAFANNQLTSVDIPDSVTAIANGAFVIIN